MLDFSPWEYGRHSMSGHSMPGRDAGNNGDLTDPRQQLLSGNLKCGELAQKAITLWQAQRATAAAAAAATDDTGSDAAATDDHDELLLVLLKLDFATKRSVTLAKQLLKQPVRSVSLIASPGQSQLSPSHSMMSEGMFMATPSAPSTPSFLSAGLQAFNDSPFLRLSALSEASLETEVTQVLIHSPAHEVYLHTTMDGSSVAASANVAHSLVMWKLHRFKGEKRVAIQNVGNGLWLCAERDGTLQCVRMKTLDHGLWRLMPVIEPAATAAAGVPCFALLSHHKRFLGIESASSARRSTDGNDAIRRVVADQQGCQVSEHFTLTVHFGGTTSPPRT